MKIVCEKKKMCDVRRVRHIGRPCTRWLDTVKNACIVKSMDLIYAYGKGIDKEQWKAFVN